MHGLKALVAGMSLLILIGLALLIYGFHKKGGAGEKMLETTVTLPKDGGVRSLSLSGNNLALHVTTASRDYIYIMNTEKGTVFRKIELQKDE